MMPSFVRLEARSNWGSIEYWAPGNALPDRRVPLRAGIEIEVLFSDGHRETLVLCQRIRHGSYEDMGHRHEYRTTLYGFYVEHHGNQLWIPIEIVSVRCDQLPE